MIQVRFKFPVVPYCGCATVHNVDAFGRQKISDSIGFDVVPSFARNLSLVQQRFHDLFRKLGIDWPNP